LVFVNPELAPSAAVPALAWLALDIEAAAEADRAGAVTAVSLAGAGGPGEVLFVGPPVDSPTVTSVPSERALLTVLGERLRARDPTWSPAGTSSTSTCRSSPRATRRTGSPSTWGEFRVAWRCARTR
jgi:hypothetical protein